MRILIRNQQRTLKLKIRNLKWLAAKILQMLERRDVELSLLFVSDQRMRTLNRNYRHRDKVTDVLSFPLQEKTRNGNKTLFPSMPPVPLGDVVICIPQAVRQARRLRQSVDEEILFLLIHGILHLLGYDHETSPRKAWAMKRKEHAILRKIADPVPSVRYGFSGGENARID